MINTLLSMFQNVLNPMQWSWINILQILFIALIIYIFYRKFIQNTQSEKLVKGLFILFLAWIFSEILIIINLQIIGMFFRTLVLLVALSLIVIFQPELRRFLGYLGQPGFIKKVFFTGGSSPGKTAQLKSSCEISIILFSILGLLLIFYEPNSSILG